MDNRESNVIKTDLIENDELNIVKFYRVLDIAITSNNIQSIWELSKIFTRYHFRKITE
ncbi:MAG: hypothetical protein ACFE85_05340 [Candidatus Hodarchaeota archaeon]